VTTGGSAWGLSSFSELFEDSLFEEPDEDDFEECEEDAD
jgi:hypothetical protein